MDVTKDILDVISHYSEQIMLIGGAIMAVIYGLKRMYKTARNVEVLLENSMKAEKALLEQRDHLKEDLAQHTKNEEERHSIRDQKIDIITEELRAHIKAEDIHDALRDKQLVQLTDHMNEVITEIRPNGGSSIKDIINETSKAVSNINQRVVVLEEINGLKKKKKPRTRKR
jgi:hypothetical protein